MDVLEHLTEEHRKVEDLLSQLSDADSADERRPLLDELSQALSTHMAVEERFLYPIVEDVMGQEPSTEASNEHDLTRDGLRSLRELVDEPGFGAALAMVRAGIDHHVEEEEDDVFPKLRQEAADRIAALDPEELEDSVEGDDVSEHTRDELYEMARRADITGRSHMNKEELAEALSSRRV